MPFIAQQTPIKAVLFDLDGTLVDTAPDLASALNAILISQNFPELPYLSIRPMVSYGADALIKFAFGTDITSQKHQEYKTQLITSYQHNIATQSRLFDGLIEAIEHLENEQIKWGIVTNKPEYLTRPLLQALNLHQRADCVVCGDQVTNPKPHPEAIYLACQQINILPQQTIYLGDAERDITAGKLAGTHTIACQYGYIPETEDINTWGADKIIDGSTQLSEWIQQLN